MDKLLKSKIGTWVLIALAMLLVMAIPFVPGRFDLTGEQRFSISQPARDLLSSLDEPLMVTVLLQGEKLPAGFFARYNNFLANFAFGSRPIE